MTKKVINEITTNQILTSLSDSYLTISSLFFDKMVFINVVPTFV